MTCNENFKFDTQYNLECKCHENFRHRSSCPRMFCKKGVVGNFAKFKGKYLCQKLLFNKVAGLRPATLLKKSLWHMCFPVNFAKFLRTYFFTKHVWWLLLQITKFSCQERNESLVTGTLLNKNLMLGTRRVFRTISNIYDGTFWINQLMAKSLRYIVLS